MKAYLWTLAVWTTGLIYHLQCAHDKNNSQYVEIVTRFIFQLLIFIVIL